MKSLLVHKVIGETLRPFCSISILSGTKMFIFQAIGAVNILPKFFVHVIGLLLLFIM